MGKVACAAFVVSVLSLASQAGYLSGEGNIAVVMATLLWSLLQLFYDVYVFVMNPYSFKQKVYDLALSTFLGSLYEENRTTWSFKWLHCFCNPFIADFYVYNKWFYLMMKKEGEEDKRRWGGYSTHVYRHEPKGPAPVRREEVDTHVDILSDLEDCHNRKTVVTHLWQLGDHAAKHAGEIQYIQRFFTVNDKSVKVVVKTDWICLFNYHVSVGDLTSTDTLVSYHGSCANLRCAINIYTAWEWFSREPGCGVIDCTRGGIRKGSKFLHTVDLRRMHSCLATPEYDLYVCQHEDRGFLVAGD